MFISFQLCERCVLWETTRPFQYSTVDLIAFFLPVNMAFCRKVSFQFLFLSNSAAHSSWRNTQQCSAWSVLSFTYEVLLFAYVLAKLFMQAWHFVLQNAKHCAACGTDDTVRCLGKHPQNSSLLLSSVKCESTSCFLLFVFREREWTWDSVTI